VSKPLSLWSVLTAVALFAVTVIPAFAQEPDKPRLNVSIAAFDPGVPVDQSLHRDLEIFPRIRKIEAMFLPFVLRQTLVETGEWGAVRVVPEREPAAELLITGRVGRSDGETLELFVRAVDASGRTWFDRPFTGRVTDNYAQRGEDGTGAPSYQPLYDEIAAELRMARERLDAKTLGNISEISLLRYGNELAPSAFGDYLAESEEGTVALRRLPAVNDPMLERIRLIRETEYVITDAIDAKFREFHAEIGKVYDVWRGYRRQIVSYQQREASRAIENRNEAPRGSYEAYQNTYDNYKRDRLAGQEQDRLAVAFNNEVGPRVLAMEARIEELDGWVDAKYAEWHRLLEELFEAETAMER
jgi:hypothetical protein